MRGCSPTPACRCGLPCGNTLICDDQARREWDQYPVCTGPCAMGEGRMGDGGWFNYPIPAFRFVE